MDMANPLLAQVRVHEHTVQYKWLNDSRDSMCALHNKRNLVHFTLLGRPTGKQLGTDSYGLVEDVCYTRMIISARAPLLVS